MSLKRTAVAVLAALVLASSATAQAQETLKTVATFSILGDLVRQVGGGRVEVAVLVGPNGDAHVYTPTPADGRRLAEARVVFTNGLKLEGWIDRLIKSSGTRAAWVEAARGIKPQSDEDHGADPHAWQDVANAKLYVAAIRDAFVAADPAGRATYEANAAAYLIRLDELDREIRDLVARIPPERRRIITSHDAFHYFEKAYGIDFVAPQGISTEAEASAKDVGRIIRQIRQEKIAAVFVETISDPRLMERVAKETGARIGVPVFSDALSEPGGPAGTYIDMMRHNIRAFSAALSR